MFGKKSNIKKIICDDIRNNKVLKVFIQSNNRNCIIDMNPRVNDTLNVFYGNQACKETYDKIREYIEFQLSNKTDDNFNFIEPTIIYQQVKKEEDNVKENKLKSKPFKKSIFKNKK